MCPYLVKPGGCPKGERCTYAHSEEERERFRNMVKPAKPAKPRSGEQFSRSTGGRSRSGDHGPTKAHTDTHPSLANFDLLQSGPSSVPEQHFSEHWRYSGEWVWLLSIDAVFVGVATDSSWQLLIELLRALLIYFISFPR